MTMLRPKGQGPETIPMADSHTSLVESLYADLLQP